MKILFATNHFWNYTGSELNLIGLARAMATRGHEVACLALIVSPTMRENVQAMGLRLLADDGQALAQFAPDAVFCQHHSSAAVVRAHLPAIPMVLAHLGVELELEQAPLINSGVGLHLAISEEMRDRLVAQGVPPGKIKIFRNAIDSSLHRHEADPGAKLQAVLFSYKLRQEATSLIASVTQGFGLTLDTSSLTTHGVQAPAAVAARLGAARLVFASGRSALEAAMGGAAVVVLGPSGLDGALTAQTWRTLAQANFSGRRHALAIAEAPLRDAIAHALHSDINATRAVLRAEFSLDSRADELEALFPSITAPALDERQLELNRRFSQLLRDQRLLAMQQRDADRQLENELERQRQDRIAPWWWRILHRAGTVLHRAAMASGSP